MNTIKRQFLRGTLTLIFNDGVFNFYPVDRQGNEIASKFLIDPKESIDEIKRDMIDDLKEMMEDI